MSSKINLLQIRVKGFVNMDDILNIIHFIIVNKSIFL
jgi:hypothetical protein